MKTSEILERRNCSAKHSNSRLCESRSGSCYYRSQIVKSRQIANLLPTGDAVTFFYYNCTDKRSLEEGFCDDEKDPAIKCCNSSECNSEQHLQPANQKSKHVSTQLIIVIASLAVLGIQSFFME